MFQIEAELKFERGAKGARQLQTKPHVVPLPWSGRLPRVTRLMALAIRFETLLNTGEVEDYADLARRGHVSRARITQIMNLLLLAPEIQEALLFLPRIEAGSDPILLRDLQPIALTADWRKQRVLWGKMTNSCSPTKTGQATTLR